MQEQKRIKIKSVILQKNSIQTYQTDNAAPSEFKNHSTLPYFEQSSKCKIKRKLFVFSQKLQNERRLEFTNKKQKKQSTISDIQDWALCTEISAFCPHAQSYQINQNSTGFTRSGWQDLRALLAKDDKDKQDIKRMSPIVSLMKLCQLQQAQRQQQNREISIFYRK